jgi:hypothetical protein
MRLVETQSKATLADWCIGYSELRLLPIYESTYPDDLRPRETLAAAREWLGGRVKLPQAKAVILGCHAAAREADANPAAQAAARAIGQCASTIHSASHCAGLALYGALAAAYDTVGVNAAWPELEGFAAGECGRMEAALRAVAIENEPNPAKMTWKC